VLSCRTTRDIDLRALDRQPRCRGHEPDPVAVLPLVPAERAVAKLVRLSKTSIANEMRIEHTRQALGE
jgi:hypothetical protein